MTVRSLPSRALNKLLSDGGLATISSGVSLLRTQSRNQIAKARIGNEVTIQGVRLDLEDVSFGPDMRRELYYGSYEANEVSLIDEYLSSDMDVIDLGACLGFTSCFVNHRLDSSRTHIAVEPNPRVHTTLEKSRSLNGCDFKIRHAAYGATADEIELAPTASPWSASTYRSQGSRITVDTTDLQTLIDRHDLSNIACIVDIEGGEAGLLKHELDVLEEHCSLLLVEFHDEKASIDAQHREQIADAKQKLYESEFDHVQDRGNVSAFVQP